MPASRCSALRWNAAVSCCGRMSGWTAHVLEQLGPPALRLDNALGTVALPGSEWVYPDRGLTVFADEEDERVWRVALFAPSRPDEYEARYRVALGRRRR